MYFINCVEHRVIWNELGNANWWLYISSPPNIYIWWVVVLLILTYLPFVHLMLVFSWELHRFPLLEQRYICYLFFRYFLLFIWRITEHMYMICIVRMHHELHNLISNLTDIHHCLCFVCICIPKLILFLLVILNFLQVDLWGCIFLFWYWKFI